MCGLRSCSHWCYGLEYFVDHTTLVQIHSVQVCHTMGHKGGRIKLCTPSDFYSYCRLDYHTYTSAWPPLPLSCLSAGESVAGVSGLFRLLSRTWCNHEQVLCCHQQNYVGYLTVNQGDTPCEPEDIAPSFGEPGAVITAHVLRDALY